jgi:hypothetical protein
VGELCLTILQTQGPGIIPLKISDVTARRFDGVQLVGASGLDGRVIVIGREPFLEALLGPDGQRNVVIYGQPNSSYLLEYATSLAGPWKRLPDRIVLRNDVSATVNNVLPGEPIVFLRAVEFTGEAPALEASLNADGSHTLTLFGKVGSTYAIQYTASLAGGWTTLTQVTLTNASQSLRFTSPVSANVFYRAVELTATGPRLRARLNPDQTRTIEVLAETGKPYLLEFNTNVANKTGWNPMLRFTTTNTTTPLSVTNVPGAVFYRLKQE